MQLRTLARTAVVLGTAASLVAGWCSPVAYAAPRKLGQLPAVPRMRPVPVLPQTSPGRGVAAHAEFRPTLAIRPVPAVFSGPLDPSGTWSGIGTSGIAIADSSGRSPATATQVTAQLLSTASTVPAGLSGITVRLTNRGAAATIAITAPTTLLSGLFGADYTSRARWSELPACSTDCPRPQLLASHIAAASGTGRVPLLAGAAAVRSASNASGGVVAQAHLAHGQTVLLSMSSGTVAADGSGTYGATSLSSNSQWDASPQTGDFTWNYPVRVPPAAAGPAPKLSFAYSSGSIDGQTGATNNQTSSVGNGWELAGGGFIERSYAACATSGGPAASGDECWKDDNASLSMAGHGGQLIKDSSGTWKLSTDDDTKVEHLTNDTNLCHNGTYDNDCWRLTTSDGTQYYYGRNRLPGWTTAGQDTQSTWTVPVYATHVGDPCYNATFANASCVQAWRWNLDYVVDPHGNSEALYYNAETNRYAANGSTSTSASYTRGGTLARIDYGMHSGYELTGTAPDQVVFTSTDRCQTGQPNEPATACDENAPTAAYWPDVPWDQNCTVANCGTHTSPSFWSIKKLTAVATQYWTGSAYQSVDQWNLTQSWAATNDGSAPSMELDQLGHSGTAASPTAAMPAISLAYTLMQNRVAPPNGITPLVKPRLTGINLDTGGQVSVTYLASDCSGNNPATPETNTKRCFPMYWAPPSLPLQLDWFNKYPVASISADPYVGRSFGTGNTSDITNYDYSIGTPAWRYDMSPLTPDGQRTWSIFAGYSKVRIKHGDPANPSSVQVTDNTYFQGLDGDLGNTSGARRTPTPTVTATDGTAITDSPWWAGRTLESVIYNGMNIDGIHAGPVVTDTITAPYASTPTATAASVTEHVGTGGTTFTYTATARHLGDADTRVRTALSAGGWRTTDTITGYDSLGRVTTLDDRGDITTTADDRCTTTTYDDNPGAGMLNYVAETRTVGVNCQTTPTYPHDAISDTRNSYDGQAFGTPPIRGDATKTELVSGYDVSGNPTWLTTAATTYDALGRETGNLDSIGRSTATTYTPTAPAAGVTVTGNIGPVTQTDDTDVMGWHTASVYTPAWGAVTSQTDPNSHTTTVTYDSLGRRTAVWLPDRQPVANFATPSISYAYSIPTTNGAVSGPPSIATSTLTPNGATQTSYALFDGLDRPRQTQTPAEGSNPQATPGSSGSDLTDTLYDSAGRVAIQNSAYYYTSAPSATIWVPTHGETDVPGSVQTLFDGAGRPTAQITDVYNVEQWRQSNTYGGDHVDTIPPNGDTATTTYTDVRGNPTKLVQYHGPGLGGATDTTTYQYDPAGRHTSMTDSTADPTHGIVGNSWSWTYDVRGRVISSSDPDTGTTSNAYDDADRLIATTSAARKTAAGQAAVPITLVFAYDNLDRRTAEYQNSASGPLLDAWTYDTLTKGQLTAATSYVGSTPGTPGDAYVEATTGYDNLNRPLGSSITLPASQGALAGTYSTSYTYKADGNLATQNDPQMGGLPAEKLTSTYTALGRLYNYTGSSSYLYQTVYDPIGRISRSNVSNVQQALANTFTYSDGTNRLLTSTTTTRAATNNTVAAHTYSYDNAGNLLSNTNSPAGQTSDTQCFNYDYLRRLQQAWTPASGSCSSTPTPTTLGGPAPYWQSYTYDATGNRLTSTQHGVGSGQPDSTDTYAYPASGAAQPHAVTSVSHSGNPTPDSYSYDPAGDLTSAPGQSFTWTPQGQIASITETSTGITQTRIYDGHGNLLVQADPTNGTTAYLGDTELHVNPSGTTVTGQRNYAALGRALACRSATVGVTGSTLTWLNTDPQDTATLTENPTTGVVASRLLDPFGNPRGSAGSWPDDRGYLDAPTDPFTSLTHLGARDYNPALGRFLSADPVLQPGDPQQANGYAYANNNPTTSADPTGMFLPSDGGCSASVPVSDGGCGPEPGTPNYCIQVNGGDYNACNVGNGGSGGAPYLPPATRTGGNSPDKCIQVNGGDYNACNVGNNGSGSGAYVPPAPNPQPPPPAQPINHTHRSCGFLGMSCASHFVSHLASATGNMISHAAQSHAWSVIATGLTLVAPLCQACGLIGIGMSAISAVVTCSQGMAVACATNVVSTVSGGAGAGLAKLADVAEAGARARLLADGFHPIQRSVTGPLLQGMAGSFSRGAEISNGVSVFSSLFGATQ